MRKWTRGTSTRLLPTLTAGLLLASLAGTAQASESGARVLLADAAARSALGAEEGAGASSGHDGRGFFIAGGGARLQIGGNMQYRYLATFRDTQADGEELTNGFASRRVRLCAQGQIVDGVTFRIDLDGLSGDPIRLQEALVGLSMGSGFTFMVGQFKPPMIKEELISFLTQQAVDRSTHNAVFSQGYSQGVMLTYSGEDLKGWLSINDGLNAINSDFDAASEADFAATARGEYRIDGDWKQNDQFASWRSRSFGAFVGASVHGQTGGETGGTTDRDLLQGTIDVAVKGAGWNVYGVVAARNVDTATGSTAGEFDDLGYMLSAGYFVTDDVEAFVRFVHILPDDDRPNGDDFRELTLGANYYFFPESHALKISVDVTYFFDDQAGASDVIRPRTGDGLLATDEDGMVSLRGQLQLSF